MESELSGLVVSGMISLTLIALWSDYAVGALRAYGRSHHRGIMREYIVALAMLSVAFSTAVAIVAIRIPEGPPDPVAAGAIATMRLVLLSVGLWLAWDRRRHPS